MKAVVFAFTLCIGIAPATHPYIVGSRGRKINRIAQLRATGAAQSDRTNVGCGNHCAIATRAGEV